MKRTEWMNELERNLYVLGQEERDNALSFYAELINDKLESGMREIDILYGLGSPKSIALEIISNSDGEFRNVNNARARNFHKEDVIKETIIEDDYFEPKTLEKNFHSGAVAAEAAAPLKRRRRNVFLSIILPIIGSIVGLYLLASAIITVVDVSTKKDVFFESDKAFVGMLLAVSSSEVEIKTGDKYTVSYTTSAIKQIDIEESDSELNIEEKFSWLFSWAQFGNKMVITVPESCEMLKMTVSAGSINVREIACNNIDVNVSAGEVVVDDCAFNSSKINTSAGGIKIKNSSLGRTTIDTSAGSIKLEDVTVTTAKANVSAGSLKFERLTVETLLEADVSAGGIKGSLVGKKEDFSVHVNVSAGSCNLDNVIRESAHKKLDLDVSAGSIDLSFEG